jgi:beta-N-acetylhexosaminidase
MRRAIAVLLLSMATVASAATLAPPARATTPDPGSIKPAIVWKKIPFGAKRKRQMAAYSKRHYGTHTWHLTDPHVVVEHYTDGTSFDSAWSYFSHDGKHLGEYPGVCAHFIIDTDGTIYQLVNLGIRCRHAIGMNWTAVGIEHVGTSDRQILRNHAMMRASLHLTVWLMDRYGISWGNVIGHAETLQSPYHHELYPSWRCQTHSDWLRKDMNVYRKRLKRLARHEGVPVGAKSHWVDNGC